MIHVLRLAVIACLLGTSPAVLAVDPILIVTDAGFFALRLQGDGTPAVVPLGPFSDVLDLRSEAGGDFPADPPVPPAPPKPSPDPELSDKAQRWADEESDAAGAGVVAMIYAQVADVVRSGELPPGQASVAARVAAQELVTGWGTFREKVGAAAASRIAAGSLDSVKEMADFLEAIAIGVKKTASPVEIGKAVAATRAINAAIDAAKGG
jgi:hypothetical protein